ncbi:polyphosphate polymerase domain-containing protein [Labilibacter sediminis]|nr:polyphosphate polymerase domain-containing protein [Labilibacter sediminis]
MNVKELLLRFVPISLQQMDHVSLMDRVDTKFIGPSGLLTEILHQLVEDYKILEIDDCRLFPYKTEYFDTKGFHMYEAHQNGKLNRFKVRKREYLISGQHFLEIKFKNNKGRTIKKRITIDSTMENFNSCEQRFLKDNSPFKGEDLEPKLFNSFNRITLVGESERLTIDHDLSYTNETGMVIEFPEIVIIELKQKKYTLNSVAQKVLKKYKMRPESFSKYCLGAASLNKDIKANRLKQKFNLIKKIKSEIEN